MNFYNEHASILDHVYFNQKVCGADAYQVKTWKSLNDDTKILTEIDTETFPTKFSETDTFF